LKPALVETLPASSLRTLALAMAKKQAAAPHWSKLALVVGRVSREQLWQGYEPASGGAYANGAAWAAAEMGLTVQEYSQLVDLYDLMMVGAAQVPPTEIERWLSVKKTTAVHLRKIATAQGNLLIWISQVASKDVETARVAIEKAIGSAGEVFLTLKLRMPVRMEAVVRSAFELAAKRYPDLQIDGDVLGPKNGFQLLEAILADWATAVAAESPA
jgi:hypothetical protein